MNRNTTKKKYAPTYEQNTKLEGKSMNIIIFAKA